MLFSHICLEKSVCFASCQVFLANTGDNYCVDGGPLTLPTEIANRLLSICLALFVANNV